MADGTRSQDIRRIEDAIQHLMESSDKRAEAMAGIKDLVSALNLKYEQIAEKVSSSSSGSPIIPTREPTNNQNQWQTRFAKLDFPKFFGKDPEAWVYKCEKFFEFNTIDETQKVRLASIHMEDRAIHWFRWYEKTHILRSWREFDGALIARFGDSLFDDAVGQLTKLRQISTVKTYQEKFEELANKTNGLSKEFFVSCFEETIEALAKKNRVYSKSYNNSLPTSSKSMELAPKPMDSATAVKKMTQKELEERRMKGLCYGCDEKYFRVHVCKKKQLFMIEAEEEEYVFEDVVQEMEKEDVQEELQILVHALSGSLSYKTMRIKGKVKKNVVTILIDSGSTHNFLDPVMAQRTGASIQFTNLLAVVVADGTKLQSKVVVKDFQWVMQGTTFTADMRMEFTAFGKKHVLRGGATVEIQQVEDKAMEKLMQKKPQGIIAQLCSLHSKTAEQEINSNLDRILRDYADVFKEPKDLPPIISHDHKIPLKDDQLYGPNGYLWLNGGIILPTMSLLELHLYEALYGQPPPSLNQYVPGDTAVAAADTMLRDRDAILKLLKEHLVQSQQRMKQQADKHRSERKLRPVAYKLDLPSSSKLHPVFHVSLLKPKLGQGTVVQPSLPPTSPDGQLQLEPIAILDRKLIKKHDRPFTMVLWLNSIVGFLSLSSLKMMLFIGALECQITSKCVCSPKYGLVVKFKIK
ncbi:hypothetical protein F0562_025160 [Nyssa sinensis]|uniref:Uncharacterized protein n=1 Tax=Nyssa sinensis TaxID=561372 RepID=A0A5J5BDS1_9ASTE|nr:hypothetical protein F0562_025160 [Nyssa sinensis]